MGQEESSLQAKTLTDKSLSGVAEYIKSGKVKRVVVLTGAGISTAAGSRCATRHLNRLTFN